MSKPVFALRMGDCLDVMKGLKENSISALVTDPPAGISFMNKDWDGDKGGRDAWVKWMGEVMTECFRVMKPGAHGLVWALPRTSHWTATALENAGFEIRDVVTHLFGTGFPKSLNIEKAGAGARWSGWGTALKPASEHWILVRKPLSEKTVAANVLKWGVGGLNIDACRIEGVAPSVPQPKGGTGGVYGFKNGEGRNGEMYVTPPAGRFPANLTLDEEAAAALDAQSGILKSGDLKPGHKRGDGPNVPYGGGGTIKATYGGDSGGASRFFYVAKASTSEKNAGLDGQDETTVDDGRDKPIDNPFLRGQTPRKNTHPTVKSLKLMEWLIKLITPPSGIVLDPFMGSGSTGVAAVSLGVKFIGVEKDVEYFGLAELRIKAAAKLQEEQPVEEPKVAVGEGK